MKIPLSWLKEHINTSSKPEQIARILTMLGLEVDAISYNDLGFSEVVVAKILTVTQHPHLDHLRVVTLFDGTKEHQVVTSAPNCVVGMKTAYGRVGALLPGKIVLKEKQFQGIRSEGALLSCQELGLPDSLKQGIMEFDQHLKEGEEVRTLFADPILELSLTPNLAHAASVRGTARELAAGEQTSLRPLNISVKQELAPNINDLIQIEVEEKEACPRYCCRVIEGVSVESSPAWLQARIEAAGMRSVNNVVDLTNYVMLELGQPLHAFDLDKIEKGKIHIRKAQAGETIHTIDGQQHSLTEDILLIASDTTPLAIAGVMGSLESEVTEQTQRILIESAYFDPTQVRRSAKLTSMQSGASYRFERGCDPNATLEALDRVSALIQEHCQGKVARGVYDSNSTPFIPPTITLRIKNISRLLGVSLSMNEVETFLKRGYLTIIKSDQDTITIRPPSYRHDIKAEIDLIEEVARLYGYHNLVSKQKQMWRKGDLSSSPTYLFETKVRQFFLKCNLQEIITCDLISPQQAELIPNDIMVKRSFIHLLNPSSIDHSIMRPSLLPGMLATFKHNLNHEKDSVALFEVGRIHFKLEELFVEPSMGGILLSGDAAPLHWQNKAREVDFYDLKGIIEIFFKNMHMEVTFQPSLLSNFHPKRQAQIVHEGRYLGVCGELHPLLLKKLDILQPTYFAEINLEDTRLHANGPQKMEALPLYPASRRDWTLPLPKNSEIDEIFSLIKKFSSSLLESVSLVDVYENEKLGIDKVHVTFRFSYRDRDHTISAQEAEKEHATITQNVLLSLEQGNP